MPLRNLPGDKRAKGVQTAEAERESIDWALRGADRLRGGPRPRPRWRQLRRNGRGAQERRGLPDSIDSLQKPFCKQAELIIRRWTLVALTKLHFKIRYSGPASHNEHRCRRCFTMHAI